MSESIGKPPQLTLSPEQATLAYSFLKGALPQLIAWMRSNGAFRTSMEWATILEEQMVAAEGYAREGR